MYSIGGELRRQGDVRPRAGRGHRGGSAGGVDFGFGRRVVGVIEVDRRPCAGAGVTSPPDGLDVGAGALRDNRFRVDGEADVRFGSKRFVAETKGSAAGRQGGHVAQPVGDFGSNRYPREPDSGRELAAADADAVPDHSGPLSASDRLFPSGMGDHVFRDPARDVDGSASAGPSDLDMRDDVSGVHDERRPFIVVEIEDRPRLAIFTMQADSFKETDAVGGERPEIAGRDRVFARLQDDLVAGVHSQPLAGGDEERAGVFRIRARIRPGAARARVADSRAGDLDEGRAVARIVNAIASVGAGDPVEAGAQQSRRVGQLAARSVRKGPGQVTAAAFTEGALLAAGERDIANGLRRFGRAVDDGRRAGRGSPRATVAGSQSSEAFARGVTIKVTVVWLGSWVESPW